MCYLRVCGYDGIDKQKLLKCHYLRSSKTEGGSALTVETICKRCGLEFNVPFDRFQDKAYISWLKASLCLQFTKEGLEDFVETTSQEFYKLVENDISAASSCNYQCNLSSDKLKCPNKTCDTLKTTLVCYSKHGRIELKNTTLKDMVSSHHSVSKLYMPRMCNKYNGPKEADSTAVLSLMDDCLHFRSKLQNPDAVNHVRDSRNAIMHSGTMRIDEHQLSQHTSNFIALLGDPGSLKMNQACKEAIANIQKLSDNRVQIDLVKLESTVMDRHHKHNHDEIEDLKQIVESTGYTEDEMEDAKCRLKQLEKQQEKEKIIKNIYHVDAANVDTMLTTISSLYQTAEKRLEDVKIKVRNKVEELNQRLNSEQTIHNKRNAQLAAENDMLKKQNEKLLHDLRTSQNARKRLEYIEMKGKDDKIEELQQLLIAEQAKHNKDSAEQSTAIYMLRKPLDTERLHTSKLANDLHTCTLQNKKRDEMNDTNLTVSATNGEKFKDVLIKQSNVSEDISPTLLHSETEDNKVIFTEGRERRKTQNRFQKEETEFKQKVNSLNSSDRRDVRETEDSEDEKSTEKVPAQSVAVEQKADAQKPIDRGHVDEDRRIQEYRQSCDINASNKDLIEKIQNRILSAAQQDTTIFLSDIYIKESQWRRDIDDRYLDMAGVTSIHAQHPVDENTQKTFKKTKCLQKLVLSNNGINVESIHEMILENKDTLRTLGLYFIDLPPLGENLTEIFNGCQLSSQGLGYVKLSHAQCQTLSRHFSTTDNLRQVTLDNISCSTHRDSRECLSALDLTNHKRMEKVKLRSLNVSKVIFNADQLQSCKIDLPDNMASQTSALTCLRTARNLQQFECYSLRNSTSVSELAVVLPQLNALQRITLGGIDFGCLREIRLSAAMEKLEFVELWACTITDEGVNCLVDSMPTHTVRIRLYHVTIRGRKNFLQKIRDSPNTEVTTDDDVRDKHVGWEVGTFVFYTK